MILPTVYYAVFATRRVDLSEYVAALVSTAILAREAGRITLAERPWLTRCRVRRVDLTREQVVEVVGGWGREDGAIRRSLCHAERLPRQFRDTYLAGYRAGVAAAPHRDYSPGCE